MCVIAIKPQNVSFPTKERIEEMFDANSDGAGFMFTRKNKVIIRKGFMKPKHFFKALKQEELTEKDIVIMHFRIATAGSVSPKNCHPFPVSGDVAELRATRIETNLAMAHNGILSYVADKKQDLSDTMTFVRDVLSEKHVKDHIFDPSVFSLIEMGIGYSKMVFLDKTGKFCLLGDWVEDKTVNDNIFYSNLSFKRTFVYREPGVTHYRANRDFTGGKRDYYLTPVSQGDLDRAAYLNQEIIDTFAQNQVDASTLIDYDTKTCPKCSYPIASHIQLCCSKCGILFERLADETTQ